MISSKKTIMWDNIQIICSTVLRNTFKSSRPSHSSDSNSLEKRREQQNFIQNHFKYSLLLLFLLSFLLNRISNQCLFLWIRSTFTIDIKDRPMSPSLSHKNAPPTVSVQLKKSNPTKFPMTIGPPSSSFTSITFTANLPSLGQALLLWDRLCWRTGAI